MAPAIATKPENIRNVCILAHVDHGKTTFADSLLAANNILSSRMAGKIRYLDSREDEQERGITMESSAVSLGYSTLSDGQRKDYTVNLIDTPGHVDFSEEVSASTRICDGALVLVDALEGVGTQTVAVLKQTWREKLKPILVINKIDRLIIELRLAPIEAHHHLVRLVEQVNAVIGSFYADERLEAQEKFEAERADRLAKDQAAKEAVANSEGEEEDKTDEDLYFAPETGNVIFCSAVHGWGFRVDQFAKFHAARLGIQSQKLQKVMWGDFYFDPKSKRVVTRKHLPPGKLNLKPLFVQLVLENLWAVYKCTLLEHDVEKINKVATALKLKLKPQDLKAKDPSNLLFSIFTQWLPLASCVFRAVVDVIPSPAKAQGIRLPRILGIPEEEISKAKHELSVVEEHLLQGGLQDGASTVAFISKMFAVPTAELPHNQRRQLTAEEMRQRGREARQALNQGQAETGPKSISATALTEGPEATPPQQPEKIEGDSMIAFARVYSGKLSIGQTLYCVFPKFNAEKSPSDPLNKQHVTTIGISHLYLLMGRELVSVSSVPAGQVCGIGGLDEVVMRSATLCLPPNQQGPTLQTAVEDSSYLVNLARLVTANPPILKMTLEAKVPADQPKLLSGLKKLSQADPAVTTMIQETGETVICTAGELHAERCIRDLEERFAKIKIQKGNILVPYRETIVKHPVIEGVPPPVKEAVIAEAAEGAISIELRAIPLPRELTDFLLLQASAIRRWTKSQTADIDFAPATGAPTSQMSDDDLLSSLKKQIAQVAKLPVFEHLRALGPRGVGPNLLFVNPEVPLSSFQRLVLGPLATHDVEINPALRIALDSIDTAFQLITLKGPLCAEPVEGVAFIVESINVPGDFDVAKTPQISGQLISSVQESMRGAFLQWSPRLRLAMYSCDIQASAEVLGKVYGVVSKRRGHIVSEEMKESTTFFTIRALLPVADSFGFAEEIRKKTSGAASPQLIFHGFELLDQDPFWVPTTEEELEDLGEKADRENLAKRYVDQVRKRKGLATGQKIVDAAEKQRTLKR